MIVILYSFLCVVFLALCLLGCKESAEKPIGKIPFYVFLNNSIYIALTACICLLCGGIALYHAKRFDQISSEMAPVVTSQQESANSLK